MIGGGLGLAPVAMLAGLFVAPLAMVGAIGVTAAAIGAGLGALGAGDKRVLMQVVFDDGRGFICVCDQGMSNLIQEEARLARKAAEDRRAAEAILIPPKWRMGPIAPSALAAKAEGPPLLAAPAALGTGASTDVPLADAAQDGSGLLAAAETALATTKTLAADAAAKARV